MKQTAVEWLFTELCSENLSWNKDSNGKLFIDFKTWNLLNKAKEMEKQQIIESFSLGIISHHDAFKNKNKWNNAEEYYNETFKSE